MLAIDILSVEFRYHRPPNHPEWLVIYRRYDGKITNRRVFAVDEMAAYADTVRWHEEVFGNLIRKKLDLGN